MEGTSGIARFDSSWVNGFVFGTLLSGGPVTPKSDWKSSRQEAKVPIPLKLAKGSQPLSSWVESLDPGTIYPDTVFSELAEWGIRYRDGMLQVSGDLKSVRRYTPAELIKIGRQRGYEISLEDETGYGCFSHEVAQDILMLVVPMVELPDSGQQARVIIRSIARVLRSYRL